MGLKLSFKNTFLMFVLIALGACARQDNNNNNPPQDQPITPLVQNSNVEFGQATTLIRQEMFIRLNESNCRYVQQRGSHAECFIDVARELGLQALSPDAQVRLSLPACDQNLPFCVRRVRDEDKNDALFNVVIENRAGRRGDILGLLRSNQTKVKLNYLGPQL